MEVITTSINSERIKKFIKTETPFAVMQYFESLKFVTNEKFKKYEMVYINKNNVWAKSVLDDEDVAVFRSFLDKFKIVVNDSSGKVYEFNNFKEYKEKMIGYAGHS